MENFTSSLENNNLHFNPNINANEVKTSLIGKIAQILPANYSYMINKLHETIPLTTEENIKIDQIVTSFFVNVNSAEGAHTWLEDFQEKTKTTMRQTRGFILKGQRVIFREARHCIHSHIVKKKQGKNVEIKKLHSERLRDTGCLATIELRIEKRYLTRTHPLEVTLNFTHNHVPISAISLSFRSVNAQTEKEYLQLFQCGHMPSTARYEYEEKLHLLADNEENLAMILADRAVNPDFGYVTNLFKKFRISQLGAKNGINMFERLESEVENNLMQRIHEKIRQAGDICYVDASSSFDLLNTSLTLLYTSCAVGALPLGIILTSDESEDTLKSAFNLLKTILPTKAFYNRGPEIGPCIIITDDSNAERNALRHCWSNTKTLLCIFHILQAFWRWLWNANNHIHKDDRLSIIEHMKSMVYASTGAELVFSFENLQRQYFIKYPNLATYITRSWNRRQDWALFFRIGLPTHGNHTNNYVEKSFGLLKDIVFRRTQAYNIVQVFYFITNNLEHFYERRLLAISNQHPGRMHITKRFLIYKQEEINFEGIRRREDGITFNVPSASKTGVMYIVDPTIGICSCFAGISGAPCKHQAAIAIKFQEGTNNFIDMLTIDNRMDYFYIATGSIVRERSFYASLHRQIHTASKDNTFNQSKIQESTISLEFIPNSEVTIKDTDTNKEMDRIESLSSFFHEMESDVRQNTQLLPAFEKFQKEYNNAKNLSENKLVSFVYQRTNNSATIRSGKRIPVQVSSVQRRKGSTKKKALGQPLDKENEDPNEMPLRKKRRIARKPHNLAQNIVENRTN
ncbi:14558_t:CDS:2 [Gigaspora margarita]|uniref:14558_t:CDS:1 n=1 Tax=Gigaspora margarita TaxID=4874 RepID=A0ABM8VYA6_GIGMA|nr:14558_t:CDS:2 [Gigaspora margarita]